MTKCSVVLLVGFVAAQVLSAQRTLPPLMPPDREIALAESAAPPLIAKEASIFLLHRGGFVLQRQGSNGFTCFVARTLPGEIEPICYQDEEKTHTLVAREFIEQRLRENGLNHAAVDAEIGQRYRRGELRPSQNFGLAYMLSPCNRVTDQFGQLVSEHPHLMFYAPYATNAQLGLSMPQEHGGSYAPFILFEGEPWAFLIVRSEIPNDGARRWCENK
jgi:hypothetical protein